MSTNYNALKFNEDELMEKFCFYWKHAVKMHEIISDFLQKTDITPEDSIEFNEHILRLESRSNQMRAELLDDAIWYISKNSPQANHLRFIIAVVCSAFDLERICDYANNVRKFLVSYHNFPEEAWKVLSTTSSFTTKIFSQILVFFTENSAESSYVFAKKKRKEFKNLFWENIKLMKQLFNKINVESFVEMILALKCMERIVDHTINILQKFVYIKKYDFFFEN